MLFSLYALVVESKLFGQVDDTATVALGSTITLKGCVAVGGTPMPNEWVYFSVDVNVASGYHDHASSNRPIGSLSVTQALTGGDGCAYTVFTPPAVAGSYVVLGTSYMGEGMITVHASTFNLTNLAPYDDYTLVGETSDHSINHFGTANAVTKLQSIASQFRTSTGAKLSINDMSLPWGGIFDLGPSHGGSWWNSPHTAHRYGTNADISSSSVGGYTTVFANILAQQGVSYINEGNHFHLSL